MHIVFEEKYPHETGFGDYFSKEIAPLIGEIEESRLKFYKAYRWSMLVSCILALTLFAAYFRAHPEQAHVPGNLIGLTMILFAVAAGPPSLIRLYFERTTKGRLMPAIMKFFPEIKYRGNEHILPEVIRDFMIVPGRTEFSGSDFIEVPGKYISSRLRLTEETGTGKNRRKVETFSGLLILIQLPRPIQSPIALKIDAGKFMNWLTNVGKGYQQVTLVDPVFERIFEVYGKDQVEARRVLSPDIMELFLRLNFLFANWKHDLDELTAMTRDVLANYNIGEVRDNRKSGFQANFMDKNLLLLIKTPQELFEPVSLKKSCLDLTPIRAVLYQVNLINQIHSVLTAKPY